MSRKAQESAKRRYQRDCRQTCPLCMGAGTILTADAESRARKGGMAAYRKSLQPGQLTMAERAKLGGRPRRLTLADLDARAPSR